MPSMFENFDIRRFSEILSDAEDIASSSNKLLINTLIIELEQLVSNIKSLSTDMPRNWPEITRHLSSLRGYAFVGFHICSEFSRREERSRVPTPPRRPTVDDLF